MRIQPTWIRAVLVVASAVLVVAAITLAVRVAPHGTINLGPASDWSWDRNLGYPGLTRNTVISIRRSADGKVVLCRKNVNGKEELVYSALSAQINSRDGSKGIAYHLATPPDGIVWADLAERRWFYCGLDGSGFMALPRNMPFPVPYIRADKFISLPVYQRGFALYDRREAIIFNGRSEARVPIAPPISPELSNGLITPEGYILTQARSGRSALSTDINVRVYGGAVVFVPLHSYTIKIPHGMDVRSARFSPSGKQIAFVLARAHRNPPLLAALYRCLPRLRRATQDYSIWVSDVNGGHLRCLDDSALVSSRRNGQDQAANLMSATLQWTADNRRLVTFHDGNVYATDL